VKRQGKDVSVIACSRSVVDAMEAATELAKEGIDVEVVDIRSIAPLDVDTIVASVRKTGRMVAADETYEICGVASELITTVSIHAWSALKAAPVRVARPMTPVPFSPPLEKAVAPGVSKIADACRKACGR